MRLMFWWTVTRKSPRLWSGLFGTCLTMPSKEASIPWDFGFMDALLARQKDTSMLGTPPRAEAQERKEISSRSRSSFTRKKRTNSLRKSPKATAHPASLTPSVESSSSVRTQTTPHSPATLTSQPPRAANRPARSWKERSTSLWPRTRKT